MNIITHLFLIFSSFDSVVYIYNYQISLNIIFMINDKYFAFDILFDFSDFKNLDKKIDEKVVKYLSDE